MPELPEVEVILQQLNSQILGGRIEALHIHRSDIIRKGHEHLSWFTDSTIGKVSRKGKCLIMTCDRSGETLHILSELGMTGLWLFKESLASSPQHIHAHIKLSQGVTSDLHYWNPRRFGRLWLLSTHDLETFLQWRYGPEVLHMEEEDFLRIIQSCRGHMKSFFLNQHRIAGIGNIYANEILFRAQIHPHAKGDQLRKKSCLRLYLAMQEVLHEAIAAGGSSIRDFRAPDGSVGRFQDAHQVYHKEGTNCPRGCPTVIKRIQEDRSSFYCPACQKKR